MRLVNVKFRECATTGYLVKAYVKFEHLSISFSTYQAIKNSIPLGKEPTEDKVEVSEISTNLKLNIT